MTSTPTPLSPDDDHDFQQLTGVFNRPIAPSPAFAERLRQQVIVASNKERETVMENVAPVMDNQARQHRVIPMPKNRRSGGRLLESIAAAVLVVALLGSMFLMNRLETGSPTPGPNPNGQQLAAITSPMASATPAQDTAPESVWTDPGHTNAYPAGFDPESAQPAEPLGDLKFNSDTGTIVGDTLILFGRPGEAARSDIGYLYNTIGVDLATGEQLWSRNRGVIAPQVAGAHAFYTIEMSSAGGKQTNFSLVSVSPENGLPNWGHVFTSRTEDELGIITINHTLFLGAPVEIGGIVYLSNGTGDVTAWNADSGEEVWQTSDTQIGEDGSEIGGSLVGNNQYLFVVDGKNNILKRDRATGEVIATIQTDHPATEDRLTLMLDSDVLVVLSQDRLYQEPVNSYLEAYSTSGELLWDMQFGDFSGNPMITEGMIGIPQVTSKDATPPRTSTLVRFYDLITGEPVSEYGPTVSDSASLSASGSVVCIHESAPGISCVDFNDPNRTLRGLDVGAPYTAEGPPSPILFWNSNAIVLGHKGGPHIIRSGGSDAHKTPETTTPAPDAALHSVWTDPGHTNAYPAGFDPLTAQPAEPLGDLDFNSDAGVIVGDVLILAGQVRDGSFDTTLVGLDLNSGERLWAEHHGELTIPVADRHSLVVVEIKRPDNGQVSVDLISVSPQTGQTLWKHTLFKVEESLFPDTMLRQPYLIGTPIVIDDLVYIANAVGDITALNTLSGQVVWQSGETSVEDQVGASGGSLAGDTHALYVVNGDNQIIKHDAVSGEVMDSFSLATQQENLGRPYVYLANSILVVVSEHRIVSNGTEQQLKEMTVYSISGEHLWNTRIGIQPGGPVLTESVIGIPSFAGSDGTPTSEPIPGIVKASFYDLETGEPVAEYGPTVSDSASLSASGPVVCIHETAPAISCVDFNDPNRTLRGLDIGAPYTAEGPPSPVLFWNSNAIVLGHKGGPHIIRSGGAVAYATPDAASPQASAVQADAKTVLLTNDPGHTSASPAGYDPASTGKAVRLESLRVSPDASVIVGNTLIVSGPVEETWIREARLDFVTQAIDLVTGEVLWQTDTGLTGTLVVDDWNIYGYQTDPEYPRSTGKLVSLSLRTGGLNWMIQPLTSAPNGTLPPINDLLMIGTHVYVPFPNGSVSAYSQLGQVEWTYESGLDQQGARGNWHPVTGNENAIYVAGPNGKITKLDRLTGAVINEFTIDTDHESDSWMDLAVRNDTLVAVIHPPDGTDRTSEAIVVISADSGNVRWTQEVDYVTGNVLLTDTMIGISQYVFGDTSTRQKVAFHDIESGDLLAETDIASTAHPTLSASGVVVCLYTSEIQCGSIDNLEKVVSGVAFPNSSDNNPPIMFWNDRLVIVNTKTGVYIGNPADDAADIMTPET